MAFRGQVHHRVGRVGGEHLPHRRGIGDVGADQQMAVVVARFLQRVFRGGVGHLVDVDHHVVGPAQDVANHGGADEAAPARQYYLHQGPILLVRRPLWQILALPRRHRNAAMLQSRAIAAVAWSGTPGIDQ